MSPAAKWLRTLFGLVAAISSLCEAWDFWIFLVGLGIADRNRDRPVAKRCQPSRILTLRWLQAIQAGTLVMEGNPVCREQFWEPIAESTHH